MDLKWWNWISLILIFAAWAALSGCASDSTSNDPDAEYHQNLFFMNSATVPSHGAHAHLDFFDKDCSGSGHDYTCRLTDQ